MPQHAQPTEGVASATPLPNIQPTKRKKGTHHLHLLQTTVASWKEEGATEGEYIMELGASDSGNLLAAALSDQTLVVFNRGEGALAKERELKGHKSPIVGVEFVQGSEHVLISAESSGTVLLWDLRQPPTSTSSSVVVSCVPLTDEGELTSFAIGYSGSMLACGCETDIFFYDVRKACEGKSKSSKPVGQYGETHTDSITCMKFSRDHPSHLVSAGEDGLAVLYDTAVPCGEDAVTSVMNCECPVRRIGMWGTASEGLWCSTGVEGLSLWHMPSAQRLISYGDLRTRRGEDEEHNISKSAGYELDYIVGCNYQTVPGDLHILGGTFEGNLSLLKISPQGGAPDLVAKGKRGHSAIVRAFDWSKKKGIVTGGEDGRLCEWSLDERSSRKSEETKHGPIHNTDSILNGKHKHSSKSTPYDR